MWGIEVTCRKCNRIFVILQLERELYSVRRRPLSEYCPICLRLCRVEKEMERKQREDAQWQIRKAEDAKRYDEMLEHLRDRNIRVLSLEELADVVCETQDDAINTAPQVQTLYVIGNGFDRRNIDLRKVSRIIYVTHGSVIVVVEHLIRRFAGESSLLVFVIMVMICGVIYAIILKHEKLKNFRWLRYTY